MDLFQTFISDLSVHSGFYNGIHVKARSYRLIRARSFSGGLRIEGVRLDKIDVDFFKSWFNVSEVRTNIFVFYEGQDTEEESEILQKSIGGHVALNTVTNR